MQTENPAGRIFYVTGNPNSNRLIILKEEKALYQKVDTNLNFVDREKKVEEFWKENHIFEKSMENRKEGPTYTFYDGPPTANGKPHIGHVLTRVIKDMIPRYRAMKGYMVPRKAGWDTHGLPVELEVEKKLGLDGKDQIEEYGMEPYSPAVVGHLPGQRTATAFPYPANLGGSKSTPMSFTLLPKAAFLLSC